MREERNLSQIQNQRSQVEPGRFETQYATLYEESVRDPDRFWGRHGKRIHWFEPYSIVKNASFEGNVSIRWFEDGTTNVSYNCLDRHLKEHGDRTAIIWEGDDPCASRRISYRALHEEVCRFANALRERGVKKGDTVTIYMPMVPEAAVAMLACARVGAVHSVVFGGFSPEALAGRMVDCDSNVLITAFESLRGGRRLPLKQSADKAIQIAVHQGLTVSTVFVVGERDFVSSFVEGRDVLYREAVEMASPECAPEHMNAEDPFFILYTSGSTGKPKGVLHTTGGYLVYASMTHEVVFDYRPNEVYWCTADIGWVTGHSYLVYGPLANAATTLMFEGVPTYPDAGRMWEIVEKHRVNLLYTAPTALRTLMGAGDEYVTRSDRSSLRVLGTVGEPINPEVWAWYSRVVGDERCPVVDTWWQTETGGHMIAPIAGVTPLKPGSATLPFFGVVPVIVDQEGNVLEGVAEGNLCIEQSWPGQMRTIYKDHARFVQTYFSTYQGKYFTGDGCRRDADGYYWITGRVDDVLNVSGHRMGTAEVESALVSHPSVAEAAVVGYPHDIKGQGIYCYVTLMGGVSFDPELQKSLVAHVRSEIGPIATPDHIQFAPGLPKTRSGKIMRRILRKIAENDLSSLGDTSTLADPAVVDDLIANRLAPK
nr:acetate--CoA ligase [Pseudorhizobium flavum]